MSGLVTMAIIANYREQQIKCPPSFISRRHFIKYFTSSMLEKQSHDYNSALLIPMIIL